MKNKCTEITVIWDKSDIFGIREANMSIAFYNLLKEKEAKNVQKNF